MPLAGVTNLTGTELEELCQMIDYDTINTPCFEVAEGHYLARCLDCVCSATWEHWPVKMWQQVTKAPIPNMTGPCYK